MIFKIFHKTGECFFRGEWDGDEGYYEEKEVDDDKVEEALTDIIIYEQLRRSVPQETYALITKVLSGVISDNGLSEQLCENYADELNDWAQEEYGND